MCALLCVHCYVYSVHCYSVFYSEPYHTTAMEKTIVVYSGSVVKIVESGVAQ